jgi:hypothetical protein
LTPDPHRLDFAVLLGEGNNAVTDMKDVTSTSFGYLIAFLLPGLFGLYAVSYWLPQVGILWQPILKADATVGPSVVLLLVAVGMGVLLSAARWLIFEKGLYRKHCLTADQYRGLDSGKLTLFKTFAEEHYRYHQFYGGCFVALLILAPAWLRNHWSLSCGRMAGAIVGFLLLGLFLERAGSDAYHKYVDRCKAIAKGEPHTGKGPQV